MHPHPRSRDAVALAAFLALGLPLAAQDGAAGQASSKPQDPAACGARVSLARIWDHLRGKHDADGDGTVTAAEYGRGDVRFRNFDRDGDGMLTKADFPDDGHFNGFNRNLFQMADRDRDRSIPRAEWETFAASMDTDGDGEITAADMRGKIPPVYLEQWDLMLLSFDQDLDGRFTAKDLQIVFRDTDHDGDGTLAASEIAGWRAAHPQPAGPLPRKGEVAPDFELALAEHPDRKVRLSSFAGQKPVALIFGSYT